MRDALIIGGGPAGRALGAACSARGLSVGVVDPAPAAPWPNNYGIWADELAPVGLEAVAGRRWARAEVHLGADTPVILERAYVNVDGAALQARLAAPMIEGTVATVEPDAITLADGRRLEARHIIDATGAESLFSMRRGHHAPGFQRALGLDLRVARHPFALDTMQLMDFRPAPDAPPSPASFVYVMPHGPDRIFVEETSLVGRPAVALDLLEARLRARLAAWGVEVTAEEAVERCHIPMGGALPDFAAPVLGFGAAAGMTHPATGYQLAHALRTADAAAEALATGPGDDLVATRRAYWGAVWPREKQRVWQLFRFGMEVLLRLDQRAQQQFFEGFFTLDADRQAAWLAGTLTVSEASAAMLQVFKALPWGLRSRLIGHGMRPHGWRMLGALMG